jgi:hypothetical protein
LVAAGFFGVEALPEPLAMALPVGLLRWLELFEAGR